MAVTTIEGDSVSVDYEPQYERFSIDSEQLPESGALILPESMVIKMYHRVKQRQSSEIEDDPPTTS